MYTMTLKQYNDTHSDYKSVWSSDSVHGTNFNGLRTIIKWEPNAGTCLLIEGQSFKIVDSEAENINPVKK